MEIGSIGPGRKGAGRAGREDSGEGRWTIRATLGPDMPAPVITRSLFERFCGHALKAAE